MVAFWAVKCSTKQPTIVKPPAGFVLNLQSATLSKGDTATQLLVSTGVGGVSNHVLAAFRPPAVENIKLDLVFGSTADVVFNVVSDSKSPCEVCLSGYYQPGPELSPEELECLKTALEASAASNKRKATEALLQRVDEQQQQAAVEKKAKKNIPEKEQPDDEPECTVVVKSQPVSKPEVASSTPAKIVKTENATEVQSVLTKSQKKRLRKKRSKNKSALDK